MRETIYTKISKYTKFERVTRANYRANCPFHKDTEKSLHLDMESRRFTCQKCTRNGDREDFLNLMEWFEGKKSKPASVNNQPAIRYWLGTMEKLCSTCLHESEDLNSSHCITCSVAERKADNWEPKEPEVLSVEQIVDIVENMWEFEETWGLHEARTAMLEVANKCRTNFRLERDKELQPTIENAKQAVEIYFEDPETHAFVNTMEALKHRFLDIPPLEKTDK